MHLELLSHISQPTQKLVEVVHEGMLAKNTLPNTLLLYSVLGGK